MKRRSIGSANGDGRRLAVAGSRCRSTRQRCRQALAWMSLAAGGAGAEELVLRLQRLDVSRLPAVELFFTVSDHSGEAFLGLSSAELDLSVDDVGQRISSLRSALESGEGLAVVLLFDRSGSMKEDLEAAKAAGIDFVERLSAQDRIGVISFDDSVAVEAGLTPGHQQAIRAIERVELGRDTALFDAIGQGLDLLAEETTRRQAIIVLSDGKDTKSRSDVETVLARAQQGEVPIYTIGLAAEAPFEVLRRLPAATGGMFLAASEGRDLLRLYQVLAEQLRNQYQLSFRWNGAVDESWHRLTLAAVDTEARRWPLETQFIASYGPGLSPARVQDLRRGSELARLVRAGLLGAGIGSGLGVLLLLLLKGISPRVRLLSLPGLGALVAVISLASLLAALWALTVG